MTEPRTVLSPQPGFWLVRLVRGGPATPAAIMWVQTEREPDEPSNDMRGTRSRFLAAFIAGEPVAIEEVWLRKGEPIERADYDYRVADAAWARVNAPDEPIAQPRKRVDLMQAALPF